MYFLQNRFFELRPITVKCLMFALEFPPTIFHSASKFDKTLMLITQQSLYPFCHGEII